ncbi:MAG TPA: hypothetical protein VHV08_11085 [Pirellulales bacterium]|nr:hypothetical protein [Pirellulales bacterium]
MRPSITILLRSAIVACLLLAGTVTMSAERRQANKTAATDAKSVDLFDAIKSKDLDVKFIPKDDSEARVIIKNNTDQPLTVRLPDAFAGMPVLNQIGGGRGGAGGAGGMGGGMNQSMGGGMGGMGGGMMGGGGMGGMGGGMMNIPPEKVAQLKVVTVCLEHGKKVPRAGVPYEIKPLENFTSDPQVKALLVAFSKGRLSQRATQAAAWHLANGLSWEQLADKQIEEFGNPETRPYFTRAEIQEGMRIAQYAVAQAEATPRAKPAAKRSPGESAHQPNVNFGTPDTAEKVDKPETN